MPTSGSRKCVGHCLPKASKGTSCRTRFPAVRSAKFAAFNALPAVQALHMVTIEKVTELSERLDALKGYLDIEEKRGQILEEEKYTLDPEFWNDQKKAQVVIKKIRELKRWVELYANVKREVDDAGVMYEFFKAKDVSEEDLEAQYAKAAGML